MYTRVFETILDSSINVQSVPPSVRWLWITMLMIADKSRVGIVDMPVERLAAKAGLSVEQVKEGLAVLSAPDPDSRSQLEEGRRIVPIRDTGRGWKLVNWEEYKQIANEAQQREATRQRVAAFRSKNQNAVTEKAKTVTKAGEYESKDEVAVPSLDSFLIAWKLYPRKRGKDEALRYYRTQVKTAEDHAILLGAIENYTKEIAILGSEEKFVMHGGTFFNGRWRNDYATGVWEAPKLGNGGLHGLERPPEESFIRPTDHADLQRMADDLREQIRAERSSVARWEAILKARSPGDTRPPWPLRVEEPEWRAYDAWLRDVGEPVTDGTLNDIEKFRRTR